MNDDTGIQRLIRNLTKSKENLDIFVQGVNQPFHGKINPVTIPDDDQPFETSDCILVGEEFWVNVDAIVVIRVNRRTLRPTPSPGENR